VKKSLNKENYSDIMLILLHTLTGKLGFFSTVTGP